MQVVPQVPQEVWPDPAVYCPAEHVVQTVAPVIDTAVPGLHAEHPALATALENVPVKQDAHALPETYVPGPQAMAPAWKLTVVERSLVEVATALRVDML